MTDDRDLRLAVLIDADNTSPTRVERVLAELAKHGNTTVRRAYGDWTTNNLNGWKSHLLNHAITPIQQFANTKGKNSTDSAMIIDAMDLLYTGHLDGFAIVSSDADFTRLATRMRETVSLVLGLGERKTPQSFVRACHQFIYLDLVEEPDADEVEADDSESSGPLPLDGKLQSLVTKTLNQAARDDGWTPLGTLGSHLTRAKPDFDPRAYGAAKLSDLVAKLVYLEVQDPGNGQLLIRPKGADKKAKAPAKAAAKVPAKAPAKRASRKAAAG